MKNKTSVSEVSTSETPASVESLRTETRRNQILDAASRCFCDYGFHGASISRISQLAGMSVGHIYHYFENKEAIIDAIVQRDLSRLVELWSELRASQDVRESMIELSAEKVGEMTDSFSARLRLEIIAEASRNPEVARIVQAANSKCMENLIGILRLARRAGGKNDDDEILTAKGEIIASMFEGLMVRTVRNPAIDRKHMATVMQYVMRRIINSEDWNGLL